MAKFKVKPDKANKGPNRKKLGKGGEYIVRNDVEVAEVAGSDLSDLMLSHVATVNGFELVNVSATWRGLDNDTVGLFLEALDDAGIEADQVIESNKFGSVSKSWRAITKFLHRINSGADILAVSLDEFESDQ